jgi:2-oxoglutarate ferredoxin oxidoreductase subunit alpha
VVVVAYGISARVATKAVADARRRGIKVGFLRLVTVWPFPEHKIGELAGRVRCLVMPELNLGQMYRELQRAAQGRCKTTLVPHCGGWVHNPDDILAAIVEGTK